MALKGVKQLELKANKYETLHSWQFTNEDRDTIQPLKLPESSTMDPYVHFKANDGTQLYYQRSWPAPLHANENIAHGEESWNDKVVMMLHGWAGSSNVWTRCVHEMAKKYRIMGLDLRGHGEFDKPETGHHVSRLAMDLRNLIDHLKIPEGKIIGIGASLGCAVIWSYLELFGASHFSDLIFVDQSPFQNCSADGTWGPKYGSKGCNSAATLAYFQAQLAECPKQVYKGMLETCLAYRSHPAPEDAITDKQRATDEKHFLNIAKKGNPVWLGKLMADHTNLDWREVISHTLGGDCHTRVLVVASSRSGCFHPEGPLEIIKILERAGRKPGKDDYGIKGVTIDWGGHWCYWEQPDKFSDLIHKFLEDGMVGEVIQID